MRGNAAFPLIVRATASPGLLSFRARRGSSYCLLGTTTGRRPRTPGDGRNKSGLCATSRGRLPMLAVGRVRHRHAERGQLGAEPVRSFEVLGFACALTCGEKIGRTRRQAAAARPAVEVETKHAIPVEEQ